QILAIEVLRKSADNGHSILYESSAEVGDKEEGARYLRLAAYQKNQEALKYCELHKINIEQ
ncbi:3550_t:CDS:1, partial [Racocetra fulgida]